MTDIADLLAGTPFEGPAWATAVVTAGAYGLLLLVMAAVLFGVPYLVFAA